MGEPMIVQSEERSELLRKIFTQYPVFYRGLEIGARDGQRVRIGRARGLNLYGTDEFDWSTAWKAQGIDPYMHVAKVGKLPFPDEMFDFVTHPDPVGPTIKNLKEIYRVGSRSFYIKIKPKWEMPKLARRLAAVGFRIEVMNMTSGGNIVVEARKG
jgi:hypothetical protein